MRLIVSVAGVSAVIVGSLITGFGLGLVVNFFVDDYQAAVLAIDVIITVTGLAIAVGGVTVYNHAGTLPRGGP